MQLGQEQIHLALFCIFLQLRDRRPLTLDRGASDHAEEAEVQDGELRVHQPGLLVQLFVEIAPCHPGAHVVELGLGGVPFELRDEVREQAHLVVGVWVVAFRAEVLGIRPEVDLFVGPLRLLDVFQEDADFAGQPQHSRLGAPSEDILPEKVGLLTPLDLRIWRQVGHGKAPRWDGGFLNLEVLPMLLQG